MEIHWTMLFALEAAGTIAFASSGAMVAIEKNLDLLGIIVLGVITAVGGGMIRDITIGNIPPSLFRNPVYVWMSLITVLLLFLVIRFHPRIMEGRYRSTYEKVMNIFDAVGLGAFTVVGINTAIEAGYGDYRFLAAFLGVVTGVGGGNAAGHYGKPDTLCTPETFLCLCFYYRRCLLYLFTGTHSRKQCHAAVCFYCGYNPSSGNQIPLESAQSFRKK